MTDYTFILYDDYEQMVDNRTGKVLVEGMDIKVADVLYAMGLTYDLEFKYDTGEEDAD